MFPSLVTPILWERQGNIPALVRLLQGNLRKGASQIVAANQLLPVLGVFQKLIASKVHDHEGFYLLESIVEFVSPSDFSPYMQQVLNLIFHRLEKDKSIKFIKSLLVFLSLFTGKHGATSVLQQIDSLQKESSLFARVLDSLWLPNIQKVNGRIERKMAAIAMIKLLTDCPAVLNAPYFPGHWVKLVIAIVAILEGPEDESVSPDLEGETEVDEMQGYTNAYSQLMQAAKTDQDPFKDIEPKSFLAVSLYKLCRMYPQRFPALIDSSLGSNIQILQQYFKSVPTLEEPYLV